MDRERVEKLARMARQTVSPHEAAVARAKLEAAGEWPPKEPPRQPRPTGRPPFARSTDGITIIYAQPPRPFQERDLYSVEEIARWRHAKAEFEEGRMEEFNRMMYEDFMEGFYSEAAKQRGGSK